MKPKRGNVPSWLAWSALGTAALIVVVADLCLRPRGSSAAKQFGDFATSIPCAVIGLALFVSVAYPIFWGVVRLLVWPADRRQSVRQRRLESGRCPYCDYDLRGSPNLCPECGAGAIR